MLLDRRRRFGVTQLGGEFGVDEISMGDVRRALFRDGHGRSGRLSLDARRGVCVRHEAFPFLEVTLGLRELDAVMLLGL